MNERCAAYEKFKETRKELKDVFSQQKPIDGEITGTGITSMKTNIAKPTQRDKRSSYTTIDVFFQSGIVRTIVALEAYFQNLFKEAFKEIKLYYKTFGVVPKEKVPEKDKANSGAGHGTSVDANQQVQGDASKKKSKKKTKKKGKNQDAPNESSLDTRGPTQGDRGMGVSREDMQDCDQTSFNVDEQIQCNLFKAKMTLRNVVMNASMQLYNIRPILGTIFPEKGYHSEAFDSTKKKLTPDQTDAIDKKLAAVLTYLVGGEAEETGDAGGKNKAKARVGEGTSDAGVTVARNAQGSAEDIGEVCFPANHQINVDKSVEVNVEAEAKSLKEKAKVPTLKLQLLDSLQCTAQLPEKDGLGVIVHLSNLLYGLRCALVHGSLDATFKGALKDFPFHQENIAMWGTMTAGKGENRAEFDSLRDTPRDGSKMYNAFQYFQQLGRNLKFGTLRCDYYMFLNVQNACSFLAYIWTRILGLYIYDLIITDLSRRDKKRNPEFVTRGQFWEWHASELQAARNALQTSK